MPFTGGPYGFGGVNPYGSFGSGFGGGFGYNAGPTRGQFLGLGLGSVGIGLLGTLASGADPKLAGSVGISTGLSVLGQSAGGITGAILGGVFGTLFNPAAIHNVFKNGLGQGLKNIFTFGYARKPKADKKTEPEPTTQRTEPKPKTSFTPSSSGQVENDSNKTGATCSCPDCMQKKMPVM